MPEKNRLVPASILSASWPISNESAGELADRSIDGALLMEVTLTASKAETVSTAHAPKIQNQSLPAKLGTK